MDADTLPWFVLFAVMVLFMQFRNLMQLTSQLAGAWMIAFVAVELIRGPDALCPALPKWELVNEAGDTAYLISFAAVLLLVLLSKVVPPQHLFGLAWWAVQCSACWLILTKYKSTFMRTTLNASQLFTTKYA